jgi:hypothetical protein
MRILLKPIIATLLIDQPASSRQIADASHAPQYTCGPLRRRLRSPAPFPVACCPNHRQPL